MPEPIAHHIPVCPFCQPLEILLELKDCPDSVDFQVVDITRPWPPRNKYEHCATDEELGL